MREISETKKWIAVIGLLVLGVVVPLVCAFEFWEIIEHLGERWLA